MPQTHHRALAGSFGLLALVLALLTQLNPAALDSAAPALTPTATIAAEDEAPAPPAATTDVPTPTLAPPQPTPPPAQPAPRPPVLPERSPDAAGMRDATLAGVDKLIQQSIANGLFPGAVVVVTRAGAIVKREAYGHAALYERPGQRQENPVPANVDTVFDIASLTKLFAATAAMKLVEAGAVDLEAPVASYIPEFAANGKKGILVKHLLTHTGGLPEGVSGLGSAKNPVDVLDLALKIAPRFAPDTKRLYSDVDFIVLGDMVARVSGQTLDQFIAEQITGPLGMVDTTFLPPQSLLPRIAATEQFPQPRGMLRGVVHDTVAWRLGGVSGNAGLFSTATDLAIFAQMMLNQGEYAGRRILAPETVAAMTKLQVPASFGQVGLGWELNQRWYMGGLSSPRTFGHTGYTGTSLVVSPEQRAGVVLLTNRVHPLAKTSINTTRQQLADIVASALR